MEKKAVKSSESSGANLNLHGAWQEPLFADFPPNHDDIKHLPEKEKHIEP